MEADQRRVVNLERKGTPHTWVGILAITESWGEKGTEV